MEWIYARTKVSGHGTVVLSWPRKTERKKETLTNGHFFEHLVLAEVLAHTIELMADLGLIR